MQTNSAQYHTPASVRELTSKITGSLGQSNIANYDGFVELLMRDLDCLVRAREDPYYKETVARDEEKILDMGRTQMTVGWEEVYVQDGKVVDVKPGEANVITG